MKNTLLIAALTLFSLPSLADYKPTYEQCMEVEVEDKLYSSGDITACDKEFYSADKRDDQKREQCHAAAKERAKKKAHEACTREDEKIE